ncbi:Serine/threonine-protein kinase PrkC [Gimesia alba]|uniref:Serine/threonine-protein kinase PrkC n=1 Tax=Gimesia alba TaxID=2527973 RepID=A0A517RMT3_9PLAN|nr:Serine/threonine-protein kinase PrkC [Gimesia alba]
MSDSHSDWQQLEAIVAQFEDSLHSNVSSPIEDFLLQDGIDRSVLLTELVHAELEQRLKADQSVRVEEYVERFPELIQDHDSYQELIVAEYILRLRADSHLDISEYESRFPQLRESLIPRLQQAAKQDLPNRGNLSEPWTESQLANQTTILPEGHQLARRRYGRYVVKEILGEGAFGQVLRAHDPKTERDVALKIPRHNLQPGSEEEKRFLREAKSIAALNHPNICPLYDLLETDDCVLLVMPYIDGGSLAERKKQENPTLDQSIKLVRQLALAMASAHDAGIVHRDLKPANILLDREGDQPVITDFGLSLFHQSDETKLTQQGQLLGTPAYMSPEQAGGETEIIGPASDIYSLGMILYELCTGELPFTGSVNQVIGQILSKKPMSPSSLNSSIRPELEQIILKAIAKKPEDRFSSMQEFAIALKQLNTDDTAKVLPHLSISSNYKTAIGVAVLILVAIWWFSQLKPSDNQVTAIPQNPSTQPEASSPSLWANVDLLKEVQLPVDTVVGDWSKTQEGLRVLPGGFSRLSIPVQTEDDYQLELEFTRKLGTGEINLIFPVGKKSGMLSVGRDQWCGLALPYGQELGNHLPGHLPNFQRHQLLLKVATNNSRAFISADLNGSTVLSWQGSLESLSLRSDWQVQQHSFGLGAQQAEVVFHSLSLNVEDKGIISQNRWKFHRTDHYLEPKNLLEEIDSSQHAFRGNWKTAQVPEKEHENKFRQELFIEGGSDFSSLILPVVPTGSYQLQVQLTRIQGNGEINLMLPVGEAYCMISLGKDGNQFGIQHVNGRYWDMRKTGLFANRKEFTIEVDVQLELDNQVAIHFQIDENEVFHWEGKQSELSIREMWRIYPKALGLGVDQDAVRFQKILFQSKSGETYLIEYQ